MTGTEPLRWLKSSYSDSGGGNCVEVAPCPELIHIRDSKNPSGPVLTVSHGAWGAFLESAPVPSAALLPAAPLTQ
ncbi:DUF397 domain-containing protein [Streptomyces sp. NPDC093261]|uniref:DUF397 domain-containing protein n=1 Tax=Streptomyces sp. NPDC093261 TaxID=3366037 RepID=UPI00381C988F